MFQHFHRPLAAGPTIVVCLVIAGCGGDGPSLGEVQGTVTLDGQPLAGANVVFTPEQGGRASKGTTDEEGNYELIYLRDIRGAIIGRHTVSVTTASELQPDERLPSRYHVDSKTVKEVESGANTFDLELTST